VSYFIGDTVRYEFTLNMEGAPVDLTGSTVTIVIKADANPTPLITNGPVTLTDAVNGKCGYTMSTAFVDADGHKLQLKVNFGGAPTEIRYSNLVSFTVAALLG
jgi:hypothetical protein